MNEPIAGYLSLHQCSDLLTLKWTPNQLMNGGMDCDPGVDKRYVSSITRSYYFSQELVGQAD